MSQRHQPTPEDLAAFHAAVDGTIPLRAPERVAFEPPKPNPRPRQRELDEAAACLLYTSHYETSQCDIERAPISRAQTVKPTITPPDDGNQEDDPPPS